MDFDIMALIQALRGSAAPTQDPAEKARADAERLARALPGVLMPMDAIDSDRRRKAEIDKLLQE